MSQRQLREENSRLRRKDMKEVEARDAVSAVATPVLQGNYKSFITSRFLDFSCIISTNY